MALHHAHSPLVVAGPVTGVGAGPADVSPVSAAALAPAPSIRLEDRVRSIRVESS